MPRTTDDPLDRYMRFRCTEKEGARLMHHAAAQSLTFSEFARRQLLTSRRAARKADAPADSGAGTIADSEGKALAFQIQKVGANLNQIVKAMHTHRAPPPAGLEPLLDEIRQYVRKAQRLPKYTP